MTRTCWRPLAVLAAAVLAGPVAQAQEVLPMPGSCAREITCGNHREGGMVQKTYPVGPLLHAFGCCPACPDLIMKFMTQAVAPESWSEHGGQGTMQFCPMRAALIVNQTPKVHKQVGALLGVMDKMAAACGGPMSLMPVGLPIPPPPVPPPAQSPEPKQHFRFVLDGVRIRTDDKAAVTIKHVEIEYAGDGIDADVAKCAITLGGSEKKEKSACGAGAASGAISGGTTGNATQGETPDEEKTGGCYTEKAEEKPARAAPKAEEESDDSED